MKTIDRFEGEYDFLSNFHLHTMLFEGVWYSTSEHAYQACKATTRSDRERIRLASTPGQAKRFGREIQARSNWNQIRIQRMIDVVAAKFCGGLIASELLHTGDAILIEGNNHGDRFWGQVDGEGENHLGQILMQRRDRLRLLGFK